MTIMSAIDYVNDKLAGSDQPAAATIEDAIRLMADNIGGGGELSPATADTLGGVKIGEGIEVTSDGTISAGGGYDLVIRLDSGILVEATTAEVTHGTFADTLEKVTDGVPVSVMVYGIGTVEDTYYYATFHVKEVNYNTYEETPVIAVCVGCSDSTVGWVAITAEGAEFALD